MKSLDQLTKEELSQLQSKLYEFGFYRGTIDGLIGPKTRAAWQAASSADFSDLDEAEVRRLQVHLKNAEFYTGAIDGIPGSRTRHAWRSANLLGTAVPDAPVQPEPVEDPRISDLEADPVMFDDPMSDKSIALILKSEGLDQPYRWPGGASGITIGIGYDLGYVSESEFRRDWQALLGDSVCGRLAGAIGKKGRSARGMASNYTGIKISRAMAQQVFENATLPKFEAQAERAFPGMNILPADAEGALVSLVFNRGPAVEGDRRREMKKIKQLIASFDGPSLRSLQRDIAKQIREMKRLWVGKGLDGLLRRRDAEADLVEKAV